MSRATDFELYLTIAKDLGAKPEAQRALDELLDRLRSSRNDWVDQADELDRLRRRCA